jgi:hypothetical protein
MPGNPYQRRTGAKPEGDEGRRIVRRHRLEDWLGGIKGNRTQPDNPPASTPGEGIASGFVEMWAGTIANIPAGYQLCDGTNGTPDLRNLFIRCVNAAEEPGLTGGTISHTHEAGTLAIGSHSSAADTAVAGAATRITDGSHSFSGETEEVVHLPPYYKLALIMWVG